MKEVKFPVWMVTQYELMIFQFLFHPHKTFPEQRYTYAQILLLPFPHWKIAEFLEKKLVPGAGRESVQWAWGHIKDAQRHCS